VTLAATGATTYTWNPAASLNNPNLATVVASPASTTIYTITGANGICTNTAIATVSIVPVPTLTLIPGVANICAGSSATLSATGATTYTWNPATGLNNANLATVVASPTTTTNYTVTGASGVCTNTALATVNVTAMPVLTITPQTSTICAGTSTTIAATGATSYTWSPATGLNNANLATVTASPASTTSYTITGANGVCTRTALATVNVVTVPTLTLTPATASICAGSSTTLSAMGATTYTWNPGTGLNNANLATVVASPTVTTNYTVTGANSICTNTAIATVSVIAIPVLTVSPQSNTICAGTSTTLTANGSTTYTWSPATGLNTTSGGVVIASPASSTVYTVTAGVSTCTSSINATVTINSVPTLTLNPPVTSICPGTSATLTASGATSYTWNSAGSLSAANGSVVVASPATTTNYTITGLIGICTNTAVATVNVLTSPTIAVTPGASTFCAGSSVTLTANGSTSYTWTPVTGLSTSTGSIVVSSPPVGTTVYTITGGIGTCTTVTQATVTVDAVPVLTLTPISASICAGTSATLSAAGATSYTWSPAASLNTSSGSSVTASPASTTVYTVTGAINSCTAVATTTVNVIANPTLNIVANTTVCAGTSATVTVSGASTYTWNPAANLSTSSGSVVVASPASTESYTITGTLNTCTATASTTVTIVPRPVIVMGSNATICSGTSSTISASGATSYSWSPGTDLSATTGSIVTASPNATTVYTVTGTTAGCSSTGSSTVFVTPTPTITASANPASVCRGTSSDLSASGAMSYTWSPSGSLTTVNSSTTVANPVMTTTYTIIGANGSCVSSNTVELVIIQTATAQAISMGDVCFGASTTIEATGGTSYSWLPVTGLVKPNAASTVVRPVATTIYTVTVGGTGLCSSTATVEVVVNPVPHVFAGRDTTINIDEFITLTGTGDVEVGFLAPTIVPLVCNFCNAITVNPQENTCYVLKGENGYGCIDFDTVCVIVTKDYNVYIPNAFTPNEDGNNDVFIPVGYGLSEIRLNIFDRWGVLIFTSNETSIGWDGSYKGKQCEQGVYVYQTEIKTMAGTTIERTGHVTLLPKSVTR
jgi:gliding motility-associated-like protein